MYTILKYLLNYCSEIFVFRYARRAYERRPVYKLNIYFKTHFKLLLYARNRQLLKLQKI